MTALPRLRRARHHRTARWLDRLLEPGERVLAVTAGLLPGVGPVLAAATDRRVLAADQSGWSTSVPFTQITSVSAGRGVGLGLTVTIHTAGTVLAMRSPAWAARGFTAAVDAGTGAPRSPSAALPIA